MTKIKRQYRVNCSPYLENDSYLLSFVYDAYNKQDVIDYCNNKGIYYNTIVSKRFEIMLNAGLVPDKEAME